MTGELFEQRRCSVCGCGVLLYPGDQLQFDDGLLCVPCRRDDEYARANAATTEQMERQLEALEAQGNQYTAVLRKIIKRRRAAEGKARESRPLG